MNLVDVYEVDDAYGYLYDILSERTPDESISHKEMPAWDEHVKFVGSRPYAHWYLVSTGLHIVGTIYLTEKREVGVFIKREFRGIGYAKAAISLLQDRHPGRLLANVNPDNKPSRKLWESLGGELIQVTYELA